MCHVTVDRSLIQENVIHSKNEVSVDLIVKKQNMVYVKTIMLRILVYVLVSVMNI